MSSHRLRRSQHIEQVSFPEDWTEAERTRWLEVWKRVRQAKEEMKRVVFVSGVFDLFHEEHKKFLQKARAAGNYLVVGVESDARVRETKGVGRPVNKQDQRVAAVLATEVVDDVEILPENFNRQEHYLAIIALLRPHVLAVSSHSPYMENKRQIMELYGGELKIVHEHNPAVSTTLLVESRRMNHS